MSWSGSLEMLTIQDRPISIMILYCMALHLWWAFMLMLDESAAMATVTDALVRVFDDRYLTVLVLIFASTCSMVGMWLRRPWIGILLIPQQVLMMLAAAGAVTAVFLSHFADGVIRPRAFIAADQLHILFSAFGHTCALILHVRAKAIR